LNTPSPTSKDTSVVLYDYGNILLRTYVEIANDGLIERLIIKGRPTSEELEEQWEKIIDENGKHSKDNSYSIYQTLIYDYGCLIATQTVVSVCLEMLEFNLKYKRPIDFDIVEEVRNRGYKIETTPLAFEKTLNSAKSKCKNLVTKLESKQKEIDRQFKDKGASHTYDEVIGFLELALDRTVMDGDTITLAKYNVLKKGAELKNKARGATNTGRRANT
jgi:hypothetical protein